MTEQMTVWPLGKLLDELAALRHRPQNNVEQAGEWFRGVQLEKRPLAEVDYGVIAHQYRQTSEQYMPAQVAAIALHERPALRPKGDRVHNFAAGDQEAVDRIKHSIAVYTLELEVLWPLLVEHESEPDMCCESCTCKRRPWTRHLRAPADVVAWANKLTPRTAVDRAFQG